MDFLDFIPPHIFEGIGAVVGLLACGVIAVQLVTEWRDKERSSLTLTYVAGWLFIFSFWLLYGIRFRAVAVWLTNSIATMLQFALMMVVLRKNKLG